MENISKKNILVQYLRISNKNDMADAVIKYCDENHGIVFNKHPARNEIKFSSIYDYSTSTCSQNSSSYSSYGLKEAIEKYFNSLDKISQSKCYYKKSDSSLESLQRNKEDKNIKIHDNKKKMENEEGIENNLTSGDIDDTYEIIAPEGKGKFLKFIGENYVYVLLENGTYNCYPIELLKLNRSYLKKNTMFNLKFNYKDMALNHTRNILKSSNNPLYKSGVVFNEQNENSDKFLYFPEEMDYIKDYIIKNDIKDENTSEKDYLIHLFVKNIQSKYSKHEENNLQSFNNPIKKNIMIKTLNNEYKLENANPYIPADFTIEDEAKCNICC